MSIVISVEHLSKVYDLGQIGTGTFANDLKVWWAKKRGRPNPLLRIGDADDGNRRGGTIWALDDISFMVEQGEVLGIIGRNGAGKSTLLKVLSHITAPTSGKVKLRGRVASLLEVGTGFHPDLTGRENIYLNGAILGMNRKEIERKFDEIVDFAEIDKFIDTPVKRYSSGMYVRLAFAVAAHLEPEILVVDEVLAVGDAAFQKKCLGKMGEVASEGRTVLFVSHNMGSIETLCQRGLLLDKGQIVVNDSQSKAISQYFATFRDLSNHSATLREDRRGAGGIRLTGIRIKDEFGLDRNSLRMRESFSVELDYEANGVFALRSVEFTLVCSDSRGLKVFMQKTAFQASGELLPENGRLLFTPERNYLAPGDYSFRVVIRHRADTCDRLDHALILTILSEIPADGKRMLPSNWGGVCLMEGIWTITGTA